MLVSTLDSPGAPSAERAPAPIHQLALPAPDRATLTRFVRALFKHANPDTFVSLRGFDQLDNSQPPQHIEAVAAGDLAYVVERAVYGAGIVAEARGVFAPPIATFTNTHRAGAADLADGLAISVDLDGGDTGAKLRELTAILGAPTMVVASGGEWPNPANGAVHDKLHLHWRLAAPARTLEDHARLCDARRWAARLTGGDGTAGPIVHPLRWPGTLHLKAEPRFARIVEQSDTEVGLGGALEALEAAGQRAGISLKSRATTPATVRVTVEDDKPANVARFAEHCRRAEPAVSGVWHDLSRNLAAEAVRCALSVEKAIEVMLEEWVPRGSGFFEDGRHERWPADVEGSYQWALGFREHGAHSVDAQREAFQGLVVVPPPQDMAGQAALSALSAPAGSRLRFVPQPECRTGEPRRYVVKGLIAQGDVAIVLGAPGAGKSAFTPLVCQAVASGGAAFGRRTRQGRVFYVAAEDAHGLRGRMQALGERHGDAPAFVLVEGVADLFTPGGQAAELLESVRERKPAVVVIDTLAAANPGLRESESDDMGRVIAFARQLATGADGAPGPAVILVHHTPKAGDTPRGHSSLNGAADVVILLTRDEDSGVVSARLTKNRNGPAFGVEMAFQIESAVIGQDEDGDEISAALAVEVEASSLRKERGLSGQVRTCLALLDTLILDGGADVETTPAGLTLAGVPLGGCASALTAAWQAGCDMHRVSDAGEADSRAKAFRRAKKALLDRRLLVEIGERVYRLRGAGE